jgi:hypothetical protein
MLVPRFEISTLNNDGLMRFNNRIYVPPNNGLRILNLIKYPTTVYMVHPGVTNMRENLKPLFFWKG